MEAVMNYVIGGIVALLVLFSLAPSVFDQFSELQTGTVSGGEETYFEAAPVGIEAAVGAVLTIFFVLALYTMYNEAM